MSLQGKAEIQRASASDWTQGQLQDALCPGDAIRVRARSRVALYIPGQSTPLRLSENSSLTFPTSVVQEKQPFVMELAKGRVHVLTRTPSSFTIKTPFVTAAVKGTEFLVEVEDDQARVTVYEGQVVASNELGQVDLVKDESAIAERGAAPRKVLIVKPRDAVQWAIYYPPVIDPIATADTPSALSEAANLYRGGQVDEALQQLEQVPTESRNYAFHTFRASLSLLTGSKDAAVQDIDKALELSSGGADAYALKTIVAVAQNEKEQARGFAAKAIELSPNAASGYVAQSYAQQASFEIEKALDSAKQATKLDHMNALAWARVAELELSTGNLDKGLEAAKRATELNPRYGRTQTILGFANLTRIDTKAAKEAFNKAAELDQADPLPRLGLGLAIIREGELAKGREQLEIAASLDPENSLIRSYLGKAYYEEKRDELAGRQFELAKERDPKDPTPLLYDAIRKLSTNSPAEALYELNKSIELNDHRAVYRSKLQLDQDSAARRVSVANIYRELDFAATGELEATRSLVERPEDYSAHKFVADMYATLPRHEVARVSEILQSQLRQTSSVFPTPLDALEVRPFLSKPGVLREASLGTALNELSSLVNANAASVGFEGLVGNRGTSGEQVTLAGNHRSFSFTVGQLHFETDGFDSNGLLNKDAYDGLFQVGITPYSSLQFEARRLESNRRETRFSFDPDVTQRIRIEEGGSTLRTGWRQLFSPTSELILSVLREERRLDLSDVEDPLVLQTLDSRGTSSELQYLYSPKGGHITAGLGHFEGRDAFRVGNFGFSTRFDNAYIYTTFVRPIPKVSVQVGASVDRFKFDHAVRDYLNPKLGVFWNPIDKTTIYASFFKAVKRPLIANQTIEPTQVATFIQFFDDAAFTRSEVSGIGLQHKIDRISSVGGEAMIRRLTVPVFTLDGFVDYGWHESIERLFYYLAVPTRKERSFLPSASFSLALELQREKFRRTEELTGREGFLDLVTTSCPLSVGVFFISGLSAKFKITRLDQNGTLLAFPDSSRVSTTTRLWTTDMLLSYRLAKRFGSITFGVKNVFDKTSQFQETDFANPRFSNHRFFYGDVSLEF